MSSENKIARLKELIREHRYVDARQVLLTIDDPRAADWLRKIDQLERPPIALRILAVVAGFLSLLCFAGAAWYGASTVFMPSAGRYLGPFILLIALTIIFRGVAGQLKRTRGR